MGMGFIISSDTLGFLIIVDNWAHLRCNIIYADLLLSILNLLYVPIVVRSIDCKAGIVFCIVMSAVSYITPKMSR